MHIVRHYEAIPEDARGAVVAIGNFDGVHRGHQALIDAARQIAHDLDAPLGVLAFEPHPQEFFRRSPEKFRLTPFRTKTDMLKRLEVEIVYAIPFNADIAAMTADEFIEIVLVKGMGVRHVLIGNEFQFGKNRTGDAATMQEAAQRLGFGITVFSPVMEMSDHKISSTDIRNAIKEGRPRDAAKLLGHWWTVSGHVQAGDQRGRTIGFPTANIPLKGYVEPALGVYVVRVDLGDRQFGGVANFGRRPTFDKQDTILEVHIFDFNEDIYGRQIDVSFLDYLRSERKFDGLDSLKKQIAADSEKAREILASNPQP